MIALGHQNQPGEPEGTRANRLARRTIRFRTIVAGVLLAAFFAVAVGGETASLTVVNQTAHVVRVVVSGKIFPAVVPGARVTYESGGAATVSARVSYAPGQGVEGSAERSFPLSPAAGVSSSDYSVVFGCRMGGTVTAPASGGATMWNVTPDTLAVTKPLP